MSKYIPLSVPNLKGNELELVSQTIETEWVSTGGAFINQFEDKIADYVGAKGAVSCQNGTSGLHTALMVTGIGAGDEVLAPTLTFIASVNPIKYVGAEPVFIDCDDTLCLDPQKIQEFIDEECVFDGTVLTNKQSKRPVKAIMVVHIFGEMADMEKILEIAERYSLIVIEDACEALGTYYTEGPFKGAHAGTMGHVGVYSFNGNKIMTTGGGGMIVSNDEELLARARHLTTQAKVDEWYFIHDQIGYNYRMTNVQAALGIAQLGQLEGFIKTKEANYQAYLEQGIELTPFRADVRSNRWFYSHLSSERDALLHHLADNNIQARPIWYLIHKLEPYMNSQSFKIEKAEEYWQKIVNIPCSTNLLPEDLELVCNVIKSYGA